MGNLLNVLDDRWSASLVDQWRQVSASFDLRALL